MVSSATIFKRSLAGFLLALFAFGITPKITLHDLVARHQDTRRTTGDSTDTIRPSGYSCQVDDLVVESLFTQSELHLDLSAPVFFADYIINSSTGCPSITHLFFELRGPPALA